MAQAIADILFTTTTSGVEKARFQLLLRKWRKELFSNAALSASDQRAFVNNWLGDFENIFRNESVKINVLEGYTGYTAAGVGVDAVQSEELFLEAYRNTVQSLSGKDLTWARLQRNSLAGRIANTGVKEMYTIYDNFLIEAQGLGLTQAEKVETFMNTLGKDWTTLQDSLGRKWIPENYARMYSNTRGSQMYDEIFEDEMLSLGNDVVQVSNHGTTTPICIQFEGKVYSLTGDDDSPLRALPQRPPFHPNCKHVLVSRPKLKNRDARKINFVKDKDIKKKNATFTKSQKKTVVKQTKWNVENRPPKGL